MAVAVSILVPWMASPSRANLKSVSVSGGRPGDLIADSNATGEPQAIQRWLAGQPDNNGGDDDADGVLWSGDSGFTRRGFWNDAPDSYNNAISTFPLLNNGGYIIERDANAVAVPLPPALCIAPVGMIMALRARRWVLRR
jgi:hypothetical protein